MTEGRYKKIYVDWWNIRKSTIYTAVTVIVLAGSVAGGLWWASRNNWFVPAETREVPKDAARIVSFEGDVRITRAATRETILVTKETWVAAGDTIQTQADGRAIVQMIDGSTYSVRPNSTVVVKTSTTLLGGKDVRVTLDDGQLNVRTEDEQDAQNIVEVADSENRLLPNTDASFNADATTNGGEIRISRGSVETTIAGETSTINQDEFAAVDAGRLSARERLLAPPRPVSPGNSAQLVAPGDAGASVAFNWQDPDGNPAASFHLQIARSPYFAADSMLVDRTAVTSRSFRLAGLMPGTYYWRLRATARSGQTTNWNDAWRFTVVRRGESIAIDAAEWNVERIGGIVYIISGRTRPGMMVRSQGRETVSRADGSFRLQISSPSVEASVEIGDDRGNRTGFVMSLRNGAVLRRY